MLGGYQRIITFRTRPGVLSRTIDSLDDRCRGDVLPAYLLDGSSLSGSPVHGCGDSSMIRVPYR
jgi:hypothetical protein